MNARRLVALALLAALALPAARAAGAPGFEVGADLSSLPQVEAHGGRFRDGRGEADALVLLRRHGFTSVRLRVWHSPEDGACGLDSTLRLARRARAAGLSLLVDLHYSDTWADPGHQSKPEAWRALDVATLADSVEAWSRAVVGALVAQGTPPAYVQVGNEVDAGLLWNEGRVDGQWNQPAQWASFTALLAAGARGVRAAAPRARVIVHLAAGGDTRGCGRILDHLVAAHVPFDVVGLSYYPWWHGTLDDLARNLDAIVARYRKDVAVVETGYPWTLRWADDTANIVGEPDQLLDDFLATPVGQAHFAAALTRTVSGTTAARGIGVWWWEPAWIPAESFGSPWENCALFDSTRTLLPAADALVP